MAETSRLPSAATVPPSSSALVAAAQRVQHVVAEHGGDLQARATPSSRATSATLRAAASGLAAPMLVTMRTPFRRHAGSTARIRAASSGS